MATYPTNLKEFFLFAHIWLIITLLTPLTRLFKLPRLLQLLSPARVTPGRWPTDKVVSFTDTILEQERFIYRRNCFKRSLSLYYFLSRLGLPVQINLGVRKEEGKLKGHGWLTLQGKPYLEAGVPDFRVIYCFPQET